MSRIAWIGLGSIGEAICRNLAQYGPVEEPVIVWNRTISKAESLAETSDKLVAAKSLADAVSAADIICICLVDDAAVDGAIDMAMAQTSVSGKVFVDMSTVHPDTNEAQSEKLAKVDAAYLACPIFGGVAMAIERQTTLVLAGPSEAITKFEPFTAGVICKNTIRLADQPLQHASLLKLVGNYFRFASIEILCETSVLSEKIGLPKETLAQFVSTVLPGPTVGQLALLHSGAYSDLTSNLPPISMAVKENGYLNELAQTNGVKLRTLDTLTAHTKRVNEAKGPDAKLLSIHGSIREENGLPFDV